MGLAKNTFNFIADAVDINIIKSVRSPAWDDVIEVVDTNTANIGLNNSDINNVVNEVIDELFD